MADRQDEEPIGEMKLPGRMRFGARSMALAGYSIGLGVVGVVGHAANQTTSSPPLTL